MSIRAFIEFLCPPSASEIARERDMLIDKRRREVRLHRPVAEIDARLRVLTNAQLRKTRKRGGWVRA